MASVKMKVLLDHFLVKCVSDKIVWRTVTDCVQFSNFPIYLTDSIRTFRVHCSPPQDDEGRCGFSVYTRSCGG